MGANLLPRAAGSPDPPLPEPPSPLPQVELSRGNNVLYWRTTAFSVWAKVPKPVLVRNIGITGSGARGGGPSTPPHLPHPHPEPLRLRQGWLTPPSASPANPAPSPPPPALPPASSAPPSPSPAEGPPPASPATPPPTPVRSGGRTCPPPPRLLSAPPPRWQLAPLVPPSPPCGDAGGSEGQGRGMMCWQGGGTPWGHR